MLRLIVNTDDPPIYSAVSEGIIVFVTNGVVFEKVITFGVMLIFSIPGGKMFKVKRIARSILVCNYLVLALTASLGASVVPINILSEAYHISGDYSSFVEASSYQDSYDIFSDEPLGFDTLSYGNFHLGMAESNAGQFSVHVAATGWALDGGEASALAEGVWTFESNVDVLRITLEYWGNVKKCSSFSGVEIMLTDLTVGSQILYDTLTHPMPDWSLPGLVVYEVNLDMTHEYDLIISANTAVENGGSYIDVVATISSVPEPSSVLLLGLGAIVFLRKQK